MERQRPFGLVDYLLLLIIVVVAGGVRVGYLLALSEGGNSSGPLSVQDASPQLALPSDTEMNGRTKPGELDALTHNMSEHNWFGSLAPLANAEEPTAHVAPGYAWMLGLLTRQMGTDDAAILVRKLQCLFSVLTVGLWFLFARYAFCSRLVAFLAGLLTSVHPFWIVNSVALNDGTATTFLLALVMFLGSVAGQSAGAFSSLLYGLSLAGLALMRASLLPFTLVAMLWLMWRSRRIERGWLAAVLAFLGFVNGLAPWGIRNYKVFGEPVPIADSTYYHIWQGNNPRAGGGAMNEQELVEALAEARGVSESDVRKELAVLSQPQRYRRLARDVFEEVKAHPTETGYCRLCAAVFFFLGEGTSRSAVVARFEADEESDVPDWLSTSYSPILMGSLGLMLLLALIGWRWTYPWKGRAALSSLALIWIPLPYIIDHAELLHGPRMPLDGVLLTYAAFVVACLWPPTGKALLAGPKWEASE